MLQLLFWSLKNDLRCPVEGYRLPAEIVNGGRVGGTRGLRGSAIGRTVCLSYSTRASMPRDLGGLFLVYVQVFFSVLTTAVYASPSFEKQFLPEGPPSPFFVFNVLSCGVDAALNNLQRVSLLRQQGGLHRPVVLVRGTAHDLGDRRHGGRGGGEVPPGVVQQGGKNDDVIAAPTFESTAETVRGQLRCRRRCDDDTVCMQMMSV